jgi:hypothetical protein
MLLILAFSVSSSSLLDLIVEIEAAYIGDLRYAPVKSGSRGRSLLESAVSPSNPVGGRTYTRRD